MFAAGELKTAAFRVCFSDWSPGGQVRARCPYVGTFTVTGNSALASGMPMRIFHVMSLLGAILGAAAMAFASMVLVRRPEGVWESLLAGLPFVGVLSLLGWIIARWRAVRLPVTIGELRFDMADDALERYVHILRPDGRWLYLTPHPKYPADFHRLHAGLVEILSGEINAIGA
jgi:hypothetical protein